MTKHASPAKQCGVCRHFCNDPAAVEQAMPGLTSMGSGYASVRSDDGICSVHDRYLTAYSVCDRFEPVS